MEPAKKPRLEERATIRGYPVCYEPVDVKLLPANYYRAVSAVGIDLDEGNRLKFVDKDGHSLSVDQIKDRLRYLIDMCLEHCFEYRKDSVAHDDELLISSLKKKYAPYAIIYEEMLRNDLFRNGVHVKLNDIRYVSELENKLIVADTVSLYQGFPVVVNHGPPKDHQLVGLGLENQKRLFEMSGFNLEIVASPISEVFQCEEFGIKNRHRYYNQVYRRTGLDKDIIWKMYARRLVLVYRDTKNLLEDVQISSKGEVQVSDESAENNLDYSVMHKYKFGRILAVALKKAGLFIRLKINT